MQIPINKEIRHYQEEIFLGLNLRQMICSGAAIAVAVAVYLGLTPLLGHETAGWVCIVAAAPTAAATPSPRQYNWIMLNGTSSTRQV